MINVSEIFSTEFHKDKIDDIKSHKYGENWPVVYIIHNSKEAYVGETTSAVRRTRNHLENNERKRLEEIKIISDEDFNKSVSLDLESKLIEYMSADGLFMLQNGNKGLQDHNYFQKNLYEEKFKIIWNQLKKLDLAENKILDIENSDLFKLSPFKTLTDEQVDIVESIVKYLNIEQKSNHIIHGEPGSGKTVLAVYLVKYLIENSNEKIKNIGLVVPMTSLRNTIKSVFKNVKGLKTSMVIGPYDVAKKDYDLLIIDEAHRLARRKQLSNYGAFDKASKKLGFDKEKCTQLDWILKQGKHVVLFYDKNQTVKPTDIPKEYFFDIDANKYTLSSQFRVKAGKEYSKYIENILNQKVNVKENFGKYDLRVYDNVNEMVEEIKTRNQEVGLSRNVAGYAWKWISKKNPELYDISIDGYKYKWNSINNDWVNSKNAINEIGCIHTVQGYDLNYAGVIIGPELIYRNGSIEYISENYKDTVAKDLSLSQEEMKQYIINIYKTLLTRGIYGTYIFACDKELRKYLSRFI